MNILLRKCTLEDLDVLRELSIRTFYETFAHHNTMENMNAYLKYAFDVEKLSNELNDRHSVFYFLYFKEKLAGYLKLNEAPSQTEINDNASLEIERIYVLSEFQREGLGSYLMERAIAMATERKKQYVWLGVWEKNENAIRFYKKNGFYEIGTHSFFMGDDEQIDYIMRKDLI
ncbi:MAG: GNAT family N-acetyltransferase [Cellulosilyticum sp.]|nr:GNAT family N-acetyltransferase [Cellulosilyticum sp.]